MDLVGPTYSHGLNQKCTRRKSFFLNRKLIEYKRSETMLYTKRIKISLNSRCRIDPTSLLLMLGSLWNFA